MAGTPLWMIRLIKALFPYRFRPGEREQAVVMMNRSKAWYEGEELK